jgi:restriction system protein
LISPFSDYGVNITSTEFEIVVKQWLESSGSDLKDLQVQHDIKSETHDGTYQIDVFATFDAFGSEFKVIVECKKHKNAISRATVQVLHDRIRSLGAHKGMLFATTGFQSGAIKYAKAHGIALVKITEGEACYETRSAEPTLAPSWLNFPKFMGWHIYENENVNISLSAIQFTENNFLTIVSGS